MTKFNDYEEEDDQKTAIKPSFNAVLDPSNPLRFLEAVFAFLAIESDVFKSNSVVNDVIALVRIAKGKAEKRREKVEGKKPAKIVNDDEPLVENKGPRGTVPNEADSLNLDKYSWSQSIEEVTVNIPVSAETESVLCVITKNHLKVGLEGQPPIIDGELFKPVKPDYCCWSFKDQTTISVLLIKQNGIEWWKCLVKKGVPEVDTQKVEPEKRKLDDLDSEIVENMMSEEQQKFMGHSTSDDKLKEEIMRALVKEYLAKYLDLDSSS